MTNDPNEQNQNYDYLLGKIQSLEKRLNGIETLLKVEWVEKSGEKDLEPIIKEKLIVNNTESKIVEYGLAWLGSIVLIFGIIFLMNYTESLGYLFLSRGIAYLATILLIAVAYFLRNSFPILVYVLNICGVLLLYYITLRLHFFSDQPLIRQKSIGLILVLIIIGLQFLKSV